MFYEIKMKSIKKGFFWWLSYLFLCPNTVFVCFIFRMQSPLHYRMVLILKKSHILRKNMLFKMLLNLRYLKIFVIHHISLFIQIQNLRMLKYLFTFSILLLWACFDLDLNYIKNQQVKFAHLEGMSWDSIPYMAYTKRGVR